MDGPVNSASELAIDVAGLQQTLQGRLRRPLQCRHAVECDSTNRECQRLLEQAGGEDGIWVVSADRQRAGRGRRGRSWLSDRPDNIYCSIGLVLELPPETLGLLSLLTGVSLAECLQRHGFRPQLKWPNDLLIAGRKLGGILIENRALGADRHALTIGFGLNRRLDAEQLRVIEQPATSLQQHGHPPPRHILLQDLLVGLLPELLTFGPRDTDLLLQRFAALDAYRDRQACVVNGEEELHGICRGIDQQGCLQLEVDGRMRRFQAAEISLRPQGRGDDAAA